MAKQEKRKVSHRALMARVNRRLAKNDLKVSKGLPRDSHNYFEVNIAGNYVVDEFNNLEAYARELGCIKPWEELEDE